ncbi:MAG: (2Fe-2S)-binding protein [Acidobacteria bacterium]|nr:(2Fe-2S)-binding protein [Acidobacteriota bacterium]
MSQIIQFTLNGTPVSLESDPMRRLLDVLRDDFSETGVKEGCGEGECGACSVFLNGKLVNSCLVALGSIEGMNVETIVHFKNTPAYRVIEQAFSDAGAVQCGFCTPGMVLAAYALLKNNPHPGENDIREAISGNLCRCTGYNMIVDGIRLAAKRGEGKW